MIVNSKKKMEYRSNADQKCFKSANNENSALVTQNNRPEFILPKINIIDHLIQKVSYCTYMCTINHYAGYRLYMRGKVLCLNTKTKNHL